MNAPLPLKVARQSAGSAYDTVAQSSNEVAAKLAARLAGQTQGEVLFSPADRGRYAIKSPRWACSFRAAPKT
jgi:hypothetical protein